MERAARVAEERFMREALRLARRGEGGVEPNPMVGCVLVRGGWVVGRGWHRRYGGPHAEVYALREAGEAARGATAYVTLEPCCYEGKTPACTEALIRARVGRVVASVRDPNPRVSGRGLRALGRAGIEVETGFLEEEGAELIAPFRKWILTGEPWVILKWGQSVDGKIATRSGESKWITDEAARRHAHGVRGRVDGIIVGIGTVLSDDPMLTCRWSRRRRVAARVVLDTRLRTPTGARLVRTAREIPTIIFCGRRAGEARRRRLESLGCRIESVKEEGAGLDLRGVLRRLAASGMSRVLVEGGGRLLGRFFDLRLFDEVHVYVAPRLIGGAGAIGALHGDGAAHVAERGLSESARLRRIGSGWLLTARVGR